MTTASYQQLQSNSMERYPKRRRIAFDSTQHVNTRGYSSLPSPDIVTPPTVDARHPRQHQGAGKGSQRGTHSRGRAPTIPRRLAAPTRQDITIHGRRIITYSDHREPEVGERIVAATGDHRGDGRHITSISCSQARDFEDAIEDGQFSSDPTTTQSISPRDSGDSPRISVPSLKGSDVEFVGGAATVIRSAVENHIFRVTLFEDPFIYSCPRRPNQSKQLKRNTEWIDSMTFLHKLWNSKLKEQREWDINFPPNIHLTSSKVIDAILRKQSLVRGQLWSYCRRNLDTLYPNVNLEDLEECRAQKEKLLYLVGATGSSGALFRNDALYQLCERKYITEHSPVASSFLEDKTIKLRSSRNGKRTYVQNVCPDFSERVNEKTIWLMAAAIKAAFQDRYDRLKRPDQAAGWDWYQAKHDYEMMRKWWTELLPASEQQQIVDTWRFRLANEQRSRTPTPSADAVRSLYQRRSPNRANETPDSSVSND